VVFVHEHEYDAPGLVFRCPDEGRAILLVDHIPNCPVVSIHLLYILSVYTLLENSSFVVGRGDILHFRPFVPSPCRAGGEGGIPLREKDPL